MSDVRHHEGPNEGLGAVRMTKLTIPATITHIDQRDAARLEELYRRFGNARRRAYMLKQRGTAKAEIERLLQEQIRLNSRYIRDAYNSIENLPPHVTFGGKHNQKLRMKGKISREEYRRRRNSLIVSRGDKTKKGNLNARIIRENGKFLLRINVPPEDDMSERWVYPEIFIPEKYLERYGHLLDGRHPYTIIIKRRDDGRHDVKIVVEVPEELRPEPKRVMALDVNAGYVDFAIAEKGHVLAVGRINCHEVQHASANKNQNLLHKTANKIRNIADHYGAKVVYGKLDTAKFRGKPRANRRIKRIPHRKLGRILEYKCGAERRSEAFTTRVGEKISPRVGLDVHKCSAAAFALKVLDHEAFKALRSPSGGILRGAAPNEDDGSPRCRLSAGSGPTAPHQTQGLVRDEVLSDGGYPEIPGIRGLSFLESLKTGLPCLRVKIC
jgi:IS605 OrfB family transposase